MAMAMVNLAPLKDGWPGIRSYSIQDRFFWGAHHSLIGMWLLAGIARFILIEEACPLGINLSTTSSDSASCVKLPQWAMERVGL